MKYRKGYLVKPKKVKNGHVIFTDGTNEIPASQKTCEGYGYKWNKANSTCVIQSFGGGLIDLNKTLNTSKNTVKGTNNKLEGSVSNSAVFGSSNRFEGNNKNILINGNNNLVESRVFDSSIISGSNNTLTDDVNNSTIVSGVGALAIRDNETVVGGFFTSGFDRVQEATLIPSDFTTQSTSFHMQKFVPSIAGTRASFITPLATANGEEFIRVHPNSFLRIKVECMSSTNIGSETSAGTLVAQVSVNGLGVATVNSSSFTNDSTQGGLGDRTFLLQIDSDQLVLKGQSFTDENSTITAHVQVFETIHHPQVVLS